MQKCVVYLKIHGAFGLSVHVHNSQFILQMTSTSTWHKDLLMSYANTSTKSYKHYTFHINILQTTIGTLMKSRFNHG